MSNTNKRATIERLEDRKLLSVAPADPTSLREWSVKWWQWALSCPGDQNPIRDPTGQYGVQGQSPSVFFLAGTDNSDPVTRTIEVPEGQRIFFPLINQIWVTAQADLQTYTGTPDQPITPPIDTQAELKLAIEQWRTFIDLGPATGFFAELDGSPLTADWSAQRRTDGLRLGFKVNMPDYNLFDVWAAGIPGYEFPAGTYSYSLSDGYWMMLEGLPAGQHTLHFGASGPWISQDITYQLNVVSNSPMARFGNPASRVVTFADTTIGDSHALDQIDDVLG